MKIDILTIFPEMFKGVFDASIVKRAREKGIVKIELHNIRNWATDKHKTVDDYPYGGGSGMVMKVEPIYRAVQSLKTKKSWVILTTPAGEPFKQKTAWELSKKEHLIIICGRYEGVDYRVNELVVDQEISLGDFILTGGEIAAMAIVDAVVRLLPGAVGKESSVREDSFSNGLLEYPQYTRPREFMGKKVPEILLSGNHRLIKEWRKAWSIYLTYIKRPDLLPQLSEEQKKLLARFGLLGKVNKSSKGG